MYTKLFSIACACVVAGACASSPAPEAAQVPPRPNPVITDTATPPVLRTQRDLVLLGTTDVHNRLYPYDYYTQQEIPYGLARLKPVIDSVRAANTGRTFLFDSGDLLQGNPLGLVYARQHANQPNPVIRAMNLLAYDAATIGNHEYNYGLAHLNRALGIAKFPFVTGNVFKHGTNEHAYRPYVLLPHVAANGDTILVGVTGNTPPGVHIWDRHNVEGVLQFRRVVEALKPVVREMKERGADLVVVLSHGGFEGTSYDTIATGVPPENESARLAREVPDIDVVFLGHTHRELADSIINGVTFTQAKNWAQSLAAVTVTMERRDRNDWIAVGKRGRIIKPNPTRADTAFLDSLRWEHERTVAYVNSIAGTSTAAMDARESRTKDTPIIDFVNEVMRKTAGTQLSATAAFDINSRLPKGPVRIADIAGLYVYDNTLRAVRVTGAQLRGFLEKSAEYFGSSNIPGYNFDAVTGVDYVIDISKPVGQRITSLTFNGAAVRDDQTFTMAMNNYRQGGGGGFSMIAGAPVIYDKQEDIKELLIEEFRKQGTVNPASYFKQNWRLVPAEAAADIQRGLQREIRAQSAATTSPGKRLRVLATNDFHGRLLPEVYSFSNGQLVGGAVALDGYFDEEKRGFAGPTIILDGGDVMQGTPISNLTKGRSTVEFFNRAGYSAAAIGNHEFDWTVPVLRERIRQATYGWLGANIFVAGTQRQPEWAKPTAMVTIDGVKVGIVGLATEETPEVTKASNVVGLEFRSGIAAMDQWVPRLRAQGADFVIVVAHSGATCDRDFKKCEGEIIKWARGVTHKPDLIVAGHTHRLVRYVENGIPIVEANSYSTRYGVVDLVKDSTGARAWIRDFPTTYVDRVGKDDQIVRLVQRYEREIGPQVKQVVAMLGDTIARSGPTNTPLGNLLADAFRVTANAQMSFVNNGSIRIPELPKGQVTWGQLYSLQPFENRIVRLTLTGAQVRGIVEQSVSGENPGMHVSGIAVTYNRTGAAGKRVQQVMVGSEPLRDDATYTVAVTDFLATGTGDGYRGFGLASRKVDVGLTDLEAVIKYLKAQPQPVRANTTRRYVTQ